MTISVPRGVPDAVRPICKKLGLEFSKVMRFGLELFIEDRLRRGDITKEEYTRFMTRWHREE
jgi:hypothetical protein